MKSASDATGLTDKDAEFLTQITKDVIEASRVRPGQAVAGFKPNASGAVLIRPGGRECYPAFWIRDYAMSLACGLIPLDEQEHALLHTARNQREGDWETRSGSLVPHGSIPDHISFEGLPIYFPGTIDDYEGQGGVWGKRPALDDHYYFIHMAWYFLRATGDAAILKADTNGRPLIDRLDLAFRVPSSRTDNQLVCCSEEDRGVTFGFVDSISHTGDLFFCSALKCWAARQMGEIHRALGNEEKAAHYARTEETLRRAIPQTFGGGRGLLKASTGKSAQPDVWGTAFAVFADALEPECADAASNALAQAYKAGTLSWRGSVRHVLTTDDYSEDSAWESAPPNSKNRYQNGAYWNTPTGWVCYAIAQTNQASALQLAGDFIDELREGDFRKGPDYGSPWECMHPDGNYRQNPVYMTSVTGPLAAFQRLGWLP